MAKSPKDEERVPNASRDGVSRAGRFSRKRSGDARHDRQAPSTLGRRSASARSAGLRRRASLNTAAPPRASSGTIAGEGRADGFCHRQCSRSSSVPASAGVRDCFAPARRWAVTTRGIRVSGGASKSRSGPSYGLPARRSQSASLARRGQLRTTSRPTPRCSGRQPGVRPVAAAELIFR